MSTGREIAAAFKHASTWGEPVVCGATDGVKILNARLNKIKEMIADDSANSAYDVEADDGAITVEGTVDAHLRYDGHDVIIAHCMGTSASPASAGDGAYTNKHQLADDIDGKFLTGVFDKKHGVEEFKSLKVNGFSISARAGAATDITYTLTGDGRNINTASGSNTNTAIANVTYPEIQNRLLYRQLAVWINDADGDALDSGDAIYPTEVNFNFDRSVRGEQTADGDDEIDEPTGGAKPECRVSLTFAEHNAATAALLTDFDNDTAKKMSLKWTGALIGGAKYREFEIPLPNLKPASTDAPIEGPDKIPFTVEFVGYACTAAPTGMSGLTNPFEINVQNTRSTDPLA